MRKFDYDVELLDYNDIIFGTDDERFDTILLVFKQNLFAAKCLKQTPKVNKMITEILFIKRLEQTKIQNDKQKQRFIKKWGGNQPKQNSEEPIDNTQDYILQYIVNI